MLGSWTFRRQLRLIALTAALALGITLLSGLVVLYRYDRLTTPVQELDLPDLNRWSGMISDLAEIHTRLVTTIAAARQTHDEQSLYFYSREFINSIDAVATKVEAYADTSVKISDNPTGDLARFERIREELTGYRAACATALEMLTVNPALADRCLVKSALNLNGLNQEMAGFLESRNVELSARLQERLRQSEHNAINVGLSILVLSIVIFVLIGRLIQHLSENFSFIGKTLEQLGEGQIQLVIDRPVDDTEFGRVVGELVKFQQVLKERDFSRQQMEAIFDSILEAVVVIDDHGLILQTNSITSHMFGYSSNEMLGRNVSILASAEHADKHHGYLERYMQTGEAQIIGRARLLKGRRHDGQEFPMQLAVSRVDVDGTTYFVGVIADVSERIEHERALGQARDEALKASRLKSEFLANMSHEIRTPMNGIIGMTDLALDAEDESERREHMQIVKSSAEHLLTIINDILDFSKIEAGKLDVERLAFDLHRTVAEAVGDFEFRAREKQLSLSCEIDAEVPQTIVGDPIRLRQVMLNLIGNAIKFTERGSVAVTLDVESGDTVQPMLRCAVRDSGIGIATDQIENIFAAFMQADASTTRRYGGTGLGLSISSRLVELMGGQMGVESKPGLGSTFYFTLPLDTSASVASAAPPLPTASVAIDPLEVLLVEDNLINQKLALRLLEKWRHHTTLATNGQEAIDAITAGARFDLVLMDMQMPVMGGIDATLRIRQWEQDSGQRRLPIIAMTANAMQGDRDACLAAGMDDYISKPISQAGLLAMLQRFSPEDTT
jgi:PAS domain S-box-containing protein